MSFVGEGCDGFRLIPTSGRRGTEAGQCPKNLAAPRRSGAVGPASEPRHRLSVARDGNLLTGLHFAQELGELVFGLKRSDGDHGVNLAVIWLIVNGQLCR